MVELEDPVELHDRRFQCLTAPNARLVQLYTGCGWAEGPVWFAEHGLLLWSDVPGQRLMRYIEGIGAGVLRERTNFINGNTRDREGRLVSCEHGGRRVIRTEPDGSLTVLADRYDGRRLNSPNDVVVKSDGSIWFTDPDYGILSDYEGHRAEREQSGCHVYRIDPATGVVLKVADGFSRPNGIAFSPDETTLYVSDTGCSHDPDGPHHIVAFDVDGAGQLSGRRIFHVIADGVSDGFRIDSLGNVWTSSRGGVLCLAPAGEVIGRIRVPEIVSNLAFGGPRRTRLYITATRSLYAIEVGVTGAGRP